MAVLLSLLTCLNVSAFIVVWFRLYRALLLYTTLCEVLSACVTKTKTPLHQRGIVGRIMWQILLQSGVGYKRVNDSGCVNCEGVSTSSSGSTRALHQNVCCCECNNCNTYANVNPSFLRHNIEILKFLKLNIDYLSPSNATTSTWR